MRQRRDFMRQAGLMALGIPFLGTMMSCKPNNKTTKATVAEAVKSGFKLDEFGVQLWSVRDFMEKDPKATLKALSTYGYNLIESFQGDQGVFWGMEPKEFKAYLADHNLKLPSTHCDPQYALDAKKKDEFKKLVDDCAEIGVEYMVNPYMGFLKTLDEFKNATDGLNVAGEICAKNGIQYCYHNHHYSFQKIENEYPQDIMMQGTKSGPVGFEMDIYWVVAAGEDPEEWLRKYPNRFVLSHVKDRYKEERLQEIKEEEGASEDFGINGSCVLGVGQIEFPKVLLTAKENGMKKYIVEHERYDDMTSMEAVEKDAAYMKQFVV